MVTAAGVHRSSEEPVVTGILEEGRVYRQVTGSGFTGRCMRAV